MDGRAHGQLYEQYKRKTILSVEHAFPYVKTRIMVKNRQQHSLLPIEVAIEDLQKKTGELAIAANQEPVDAKILQMVLQGCVGTTVNQGAAEIAFVFLSDEPNIPPGYQRPTLPLKDSLRVAFKDFCARFVECGLIISFLNQFINYLTRCGEALAKNRQLINGNEQQIEYHKELERNFCRLTEKLAPLMGLANVKHSQALLQDSYFAMIGPILNE
ncbi:Dedicator of cytokinesis protein 7-like protein [Euroglyphus maynei]|uniref:Dedicator of cytokinesis protein 7-like protein n=1 Tax=Euroglyphus maynei TaxID=6958 RepID=A0A1Y3BD55_EURMA|nr:Dedicator of cytokinesis protein 7-like protein [Euroglyphus maynei]